MTSESPSSNGSQPVLYVGTYVFGDKVPGTVTVFPFSEVTGKLQNPLQILPMVNPAFFWHHPNRSTLYVVNESKGIPEFPMGTVSQCRISADGRLGLVRAVPTGGAIPCHLSGNTRRLLVSNYNGASVAAFHLDADGNLSGEPSLIRHKGSGPNPKRQQEPHPHGAHVSPDGSFFAVPDLGIDEVLFYRAGETALECFASLVCPPGSGPRHAAFHPALPRLYILTELSNEVLAVEGAPGSAKIKTIVPSLPQDFCGTSHGAEIVVHPSGKALLASNRGHDSLAVWPLDAQGNPGEVQYFEACGSCPRSMAFDPSGQWLAVGLQNSDKVNLFQIDTDACSLTLVSTTDVLFPAALSWSAV